MTIRNGKFYDSDGNVVPLEFGNKDQIYLLDRVRALQDEGEELATFADGKRLALGINCVCGHISIFCTEDGEMETAKRTCTCGYKYQISKTGWPLMVKMVN